MAESTFLDPGRVVRMAKIHEGHLVADFGAGSGFFTRAAAREVGDGGEVWAVDINRDLLPRVKNFSVAEGLHNVQVVHGDIERERGTPLPPEHFDFVIASNVLFSAEHKKNLVHEVKRVLKKTGRALIIDWSGSFGGLGPHPDHIVSERQAKKLFEESGFTFVDDVPAGAYHWGIVFRKTR